MPQQSAAGRAACRRRTRGREDRKDDLQGSHGRPGWGGAAGIQAVLEWCRVPEQAQDPCCWSGAVCPDGRRACAQHHRPKGIRQTPQQRRANRAPSSRREPPRPDVRHRPLRRRHELDPVWQVHLVQHVLLPIPGMRPKAARQVQHLQGRGRWPPMQSCWAGSNRVKSKCIRCAPASSPPRPAGSLGSQPTWIAVCTVSAGFGPSAPVNALTPEATVESRVGG